MSNNINETYNFIDTPNININNLKKHPNIVQQNYINTIDPINYDQKTDIINMNKPLIEFNKAILDDYIIDILPDETPTYNGQSTPEELTISNDSTTPDEPPIPDFIYVTNLCSNNIEENINNCLDYLEKVINSCGDLIKNIFKDTFIPNTHQL